MGDYEREQERLLNLWKEVDASEEGADPEERVDSRVVCGPPELETPSDTNEDNSNSESEYAADKKKSKIPSLVSQTELNDLVRDLGLPKDGSEFLASFLKKEESFTTKDIALKRAEHHSDYEERRSCESGNFSEDDMPRTDIATDNMKRPQEETQYNESEETDDSNETDGLHICQFMAHREDVLIVVLQLYHIDVDEMDLPYLQCRLITIIYNILKMSDGRKRLSGAEYRKKAKIKRDEQEHALQKTRKIEAFFKRENSSESLCITQENSGTSSNKENQYEQGSIPTEVKSSD
ncbi:hypothetical protein NQ318_023509 [Aromia moschata]|uniref:Uncharacterized protein n=1 Tax=Aromia moschata TaxID=1265417 RepID=A0AAV8YRV2_9CUCU|nr:hypothetical protein NQ318_023509 [Aromia moschata]